jgi:hypothetical protein
MNVVKLEVPCIGDVSEALRRLADAIDAGEYGDAHNLAWVIDCGDKRVECGLTGKGGEPAPLAHYLFALAMRKLEFSSGAI